MIAFVAGLVLFFGAHLVPVAPALRGQIASALTDNGYKAVHSIVSLVGLILMAGGYNAVAALPGLAPVWDPPVWTRHLALVLMLPAMILLVAAYVPSRIRTLARHPMLVAVKLWALAHLLANGDVASMVLFGAFLAWAVIDRISVKRRGALGPLGGRTGGAINDVIVVAVGLIAYGVVAFWFHPEIIGVAVVPGR